MGVSSGRRGFISLLGGSIPRRPWSSYGNSARSQGSCCQLGSRGSDPVCQVRLGRAGHVGDDDQILSHFPIGRDKDTVVGRASAACPEDSIDPNTSSSPTDPVQLVVDCACINWSASTGPAHHYHLFSGGLMRYSGADRSVVYCMGGKRTVEEISVEAVAEAVEMPDSPISGSLYIEWVDKQCLDGNIVVQCQ